MRGAVLVEVARGAVAVVSEMREAVVVVVVLELRLLGVVLGGLGSDCGMP